MPIRVVSRSHTFDDEYVYVPTLEDLSKKADKSDLKKKADKSVEDEFRDEQKGFWATRGWVKWVHGVIFEKTFINDKKKKEPGIITRISALYDLKADKSEISNSLNEIAEKINSGGGLRDSLVELLEEHLSKISTECKKHEETIRSAVKEHTGVRDTVTRLVNEHHAFVDRKIGEFKEFIEKIASRLANAKSDISAESRKIVEILEKIDEQYKSYESTYGDAKVNFCNAQSDMESKLNELKSFCDLQCSKIEKAQEDAERLIATKITELNDEAEKITEVKETIDTLSKTFHQDIQKYKEEFQQMHRDCAKTNSEIDLEIKKLRTDMLQVSKIRDLSLSGRLKWLLTGRA